LVYLKGAMASGIIAESSEEATGCVPVFGGADLAIRRIIGRVIRNLVGVECLALFGGGGFVRHTDLPGGLSDLYLALKLGEVVKKA
jgi:hypothetical protein